MNALHTLATTALLAALTLTAPAQQAAPQQKLKPWEQIPTPALHAFHPQQPRRIELPNGVILFLQEDHELPFVHGSVLIPGGERETDPAKAGFTALYGEAWRTSGTAQHPGDALDELLEAKAAHIETAGDIDSTALSWDSLTADADSVYKLAMELLFEPRFRADKLQLAQQQMATAIVRRNDDSGQIASRESAKLVYGQRGPYTRQPELATVAAVTLRDLEAWHERSLRGRLIVAVSGDFDPVQMEARLRATFAPLPEITPLPARSDRFADPQPGLFFIPKEDVNQSNIQIVGLGLSRRAPDLPAVSVLNEILGGGFASRLVQEVRTRQGLAYAVGGGLGAEWDHPALFHVAVLTKSGSTVEAAKATLAEISGLLSHPPTAAEVERAKETILTSFLFRYDSKAKLLAAQVRLEFYGYPADYLERYEEQLKAVTPEDVAAAAQAHIHPDKLALLVVGNPAEIQPGLDALQLGPTQTIDITIPRPGPKPASAAQARPSSQKQER